MLYTKEQVEQLMETARQYATPIDEIISKVTPVYLPDADNINDIAFDQVDADNIEAFKKGGEFVKMVTYARATRVNNEIDSWANKVRILSIYKKAKETV